MTSLSIARVPGQDAGRDDAIADRLRLNPDDVQARLDEALDESMDASDPVQLTDSDDRGWTDTNG